MGGVGVWVGVWAGVWEGVWARGCERGALRAPKKPTVRSAYQLVAQRGGARARERVGQVRGGHHLMRV